MPKVVSIYDAKTNLSKLVKQAQKGETIYVGAYGQPQAVIAPLPKKQKIKIGIWDHKRVSYDEELAFGAQTEAEIAQMFEDSANQPTP